MMGESDKLGDGYEVIYEIADSEIEAIDVARLQIKRNMHIGLAGVLSGGTATGIVLPVKFGANGLPVVMFAVPIVLVLVLAVGFIVIARFPPSGMVNRFLGAIESKRQHGQQIKVLSRLFIVAVGVVSFGFALTVGWLIPL